MNPETLSKLEAAATPGPWNKKEFSFMLRKEDARLISATRNLAPELIALWRAVDALMSPEANADSVAFVEDALVKLNAKAKEVKP